MWEKNFRIFLKMMKSLNGFLKHKQQKTDKIEN